MTMKQHTLAILGTPEDNPYLPNIKPMVGICKVFVNLSEPTTLTEISMYCKARSITGVFTTSITVLKLLLRASGNDNKNPSIDQYAGSYFNLAGLEFVVLNPLKQLQTVPYGSMLCKRYISKLTTPEVWNEVPAFNWEILSASNADRIFSKYEHAMLITVDIETVKENLAITCIGYTAVFCDGDGVLSTHSCVLPIDSSYALALMRKFNWELKAPKAMQNGKYDCLYLARYSAPCYNYIWDTANMMHCWYSELPKDLSFLGAFFVRKAMYWKDMADTNDKMEYYKYNSLDTWTTGLVVMEWIVQAPDWAKRNYKQEFPLVFPCHMSELTGIKIDLPRLDTAKRHYDAKIEAANISLSKMVGTYPKIYNVNSAPQNKALRIILGCGDIASSDETHLKKIAYRHPLNNRIVGKILELRGDRKLVSTYLVDTKFIGLPYPRPDGLPNSYRCLYSLNPHNTDTGRLASKESAFWCGLQIQNVTRGPSVKQVFISDDDFKIAEADLAQAESRDTAFAAGDENYIDAVSGEDDFHSRNASAFFGVPYEQIYDNEKQKTLNKALRQLAKPVNHGANYLMGWSVLIDTMGEDMVWEAKRLLGLPKGYSLRDVAEHLLAAFHRTYPTLNSIYYPSVVAEVMKTKMLVSHTNIRVPKVYGTEPVWSTEAEWELELLEGWTRYCFGNPRDNKLDKNSYIAHVSQNLNAMALNAAYLRVFYEIAINPKYADHFKLIAQIHDSILFQFRVGHEYLMDMVKERMEIPIRIKSADGKVRMFTVPADVKAGKDGKGATRWSETE